VIEYLRLEDSHVCRKSVMVLYTPNEVCYRKMILEEDGF
jgi:hypothetical protein